MPCWSCPEALLAPEETALRVGVDCGDPVWNGHLARSTDQPERARCPFHEGEDWSERARCPFHDGDGPSDLVDPNFWGEAGMTYRVQLLIGKTYFVESSQPVDVVGRFGSSVEVDGDGTCELEMKAMIA